MHIKPIDDCLIHRHFSSQKITTINKIHTGQDSSVGVPSAWNILLSWSRSVSPGKRGICKWSKKNGGLLSTEQEIRHQLNIKFLILKTFISPNIPYIALPVYDITNLVLSRVRHCLWLYCILSVAIWMVFDSYKNCKLFQ